MVEVSKPLERFHGEVNFNCPCTRRGKARIDKLKADEAGVALKTGRKKSDLKTLLI